MERALKADELEAHIFFSLTSFVLSHLISGLHRIDFRS